MRDSKPSSTAILIAEALKIIQQQEGLSWVVPADVEQVNAQFLARLDSTKAMRIIRRLYYRTIMLIGIPGLYLHFALRKLEIEKWVRKLAAENSINQVVNIAAGFDTLGVRMDKEKTGLKYFEIDHPATQKYKQVAHSNRLKFIAADLTKESIGPKLKEYGFLPDESTVFIAEGITMYLTRQQVEGFFHQIRQAITNNNSYLIFTYLQPNSKGRIQFESAGLMADIWLKMIGEPLKWGADKSTLRKFIAETGFEPIAIVDHKNLRQDYLEPKAMADETLAEGENICICHIKRASNV